MASTNPPSGPKVPGFTEQAKTVAATVQSTVTDKEKRERLTAEVTKHASELAALTKETITDAEKRSKLLEYAKSFASQAVTTAKDPHARASLMDKLKLTMSTLQECIKDPAKRQEVHDQLAATSHSLITAAGLTGAAAPAADMDRMQAAEPPAGATPVYPPVPRDPSIQG